MLRRPAWQLLLGAAAVVWVALAVTQWLGAAPLGQDEARFAIIAQDFLEGTPARWYYVSSGMNVIAVPGVLLGGGEIEVRLLPLVVGLSFFVFAALLAMRAFGQVAAAWSMAILAGSRSVTQRSSELLSDLPAAGLLLGAMWILIGELAREQGTRWRIVLAAPLLAASLYLRLGSSVPIAIIGVAALLVWWREIARRPWPAIATAAVFMLLLVPHMVTATKTMGSPLGILLASRVVPGNEVGLSTYLTTNPFLYFGLVAPIPLVAGALSILFVRDRRAVFLWLVAVGTIVAIGLLTHAQARYVMVGTTLLTLLGTDALIRVYERFGGYKKAIVGVAIAAIVVCWVVGMWTAVTYPERMKQRIAGTLAAAEVIRRDATGQRCELAGRYRMRLEFYSGCRALMKVPDAAPYEAEGPVYVVWTNEDGPQPNFAAAPGVHHVLLDTPEARVIRMVRRD